MCSSIAFALWVLVDTGWLRLNANVLKRHGGEVNDIMLLFVTNNCWTRSFTVGYWFLFYFSSVFWLRWGEKPFKGKIFSQVSMYVAFLSLSILGTVNFVTVGKCITWTNLLYWINYGEAHELVLSLPCHRPSGPKPEIQHDRRGRGGLTLT